ncbi:MAG: hypothetical protein Q8M09_01635 [Pseudomonadota bacterium]|nr:hypothetical protein [Pseudomonadota bacterium]MDP1902945.1 hypothetical protein [Pseudomonadota bacterium]MDP2352930.1 hypothetical protein [Pseudomonadota bacterium]
MKARLLASLMLLSAWLPLAHAETPPPEAPVCADAATHGGQLRQRIEQGHATLAGLTTFVSGESLGEVPAASLFIVDLADEEAIERRLGELRAFRQTPLTTTAKPGSPLDCAGRFPELAADAKALADLQAAINRMRLEFLALPRARRDTLVNAQQSLLRHSESATELAREQAVAERQQSASSLSVENAGRTGEHPDQVFRRSARPRRRAGTHRGTTFRPRGGPYPGHHSGQDCPRLRGERRHLAWLGGSDLRAHRRSRALRAHPEPAYLQTS